MNILCGFFCSLAPLIWIFLSEVLELFLWHDYLDSCPAFHMISLCEYSLWIFLSTRILLSEVLELSRLERILASLLSLRANSRLRRCRRERIQATLLSPRANSGDAALAASKFGRRSLFYSLSTCRISSASVPLISWFRFSAGD